MVNDCRLTHLVKFAQGERLVDVGENVKVADALGARFALIQARPSLVTAIHHIALILLAVCHKPIAPGNGAGVVCFRVAIIQPRSNLLRRRYSPVPHCFWGCFYF